MRSLQMLWDEVARTLAPLAVALRREGATVFVADIVRADGTVLWSNYAHGPSDILATRAAEQRYLVEEMGSGSVRGATYADKAAERLRRFREQGPQ